MIATASCLLRLTTQWYSHVMKDVLLRYKILFIFIVALLAPTVKVLSTVITTPAKILLFLSDTNTLTFAICLLSMHVFSLIWVMLHKLVIAERPWDKYLSSLHITNMETMLVDCSMLLLFDVMIWVPIVYVCILYLFQTANFIILCQTIVLMESMILIQIAFLKQKYHMILILFLLDMILISLHDTQLWYGIFIILLMPLIYFLLKKCYQQDFFKSILSKSEPKKRNKLTIFYSSWPLFYLLIKRLMENKSQLWLVIFPCIVVLFIPFVMLIYANETSNFARITTASMIVNSLLISNLYKCTQINWKEYASYTLSLPVSFYTFFCTSLSIGVIFLAIINVIFLFLASFFVNKNLLLQLLMGLFLSQFSLITMYFPQVKCERYGLFLSFLLMCLFIFASCF